jgi:hypothetical protein
VFEFLIDNIFAMFGGRVFPQTVGGIPMNTDCALFSRRSRYEAGLSVSVVSFYFKLNVINAINEITKLRII